ncbi:hypothetical protein GCM10025859_53300 [Alicyclobacillus fastidiosus]|nr:hypothetical protein GCM10025859_53300 [Alicyclobacillus fastidiosus]
MGVPLAGTLIFLYGWQSAFTVTAAIGVILGIIWIIVYKPKEIETHRGVRLSTVKWTDLLRNRSVIGMSIGFFSANYVNWIFITWLPDYLYKSHHLSILKSGFASGIIFTGGIVGVFLGGWLSDYLVKKGFSRTIVRKSFIVAGLVLTIPMIATVGLHSAFWTIAILVWSDFMYSVAASNYWTIMVDISGSDTIGSISSIQNGIGNFAGIVAPIITGVIISATNSFYLAFLVGTGFLIISCLSYVFIVGPAKHLKVPELKSDHTLQL